jgi:cytochrome c
MFNRRRVRWLIRWLIRGLMATCCATAMGAALAQSTPGIGAAVSDAELQATGIPIMPSGEGLPPGSGDAVAGATVYQTNCIACHGQEGTNGINDRLVGGAGSLTNARPIKTVGSYWPYATTLFDYVRRAMPYQAPGSLDDNEVYAVTAYLLYLNDIVGERDAMSATTLPSVRMPNRGGFVRVYAD